MALLGLSIMGERINPGFQSTKNMFETSDSGAIQALAVKQTQAGATCLNINIGARALDDAHFMTAVIEAIQAVVDIPLSFDFPNIAVQETCLKAYDAQKAKGAKPIVNSISETREEMLELLKICPFRIVLMASERMEDGVGKQNKTADQMATTAKRLAKRILGGNHGITTGDLIVDVAIGTMSSDTEGLTRASLETIKKLGSDPDLRGIHMSGGLSNLSAQLPAKEIGGAPLKLQLENAFLTLAVPNGFDMVLGTPWRAYQFLPADNVVFQAFQEIIALHGFDALRRLRKLYAG